MRELFEIFQQKTRWEKALLILGAIGFCFVGSFLFVIFAVAFPIFYLTTLSSLVITTTRLTITFLISRIRGKWRAARDAESDARIAEVLEQQENISLKNSAVVDADISRVNLIKDRTESENECKRTAAECRSARSGSVDCFKS